MNARGRVLGMCLLGVSGLLLLGSGGQSQLPPFPPPPPPGPPKLEPLAETKILMEGLAQANFRGLERILSQAKQEHKAWIFARGQALLLAETGNLLLLRPPRNEGDKAWYRHAADFRNASVHLANALSKKDLERSKALLHTVAGTCNRCHQSFRIPVQIKPFEEPMKVSGE